MSPRITHCVQMDSCPDDAGLWDRVCQCHVHGKLREDLVRLISLARRLSLAGGIRLFHR